jgi:hypothetical protein
VTAANLIARLEDPPAWLGEFAAHVAASYSPRWAAVLITSLGRLLSDGGSRHPHSLPERARQAGTSPPTRALARVLGDFFAARGLALPQNQSAQMAAAVFLTGQGKNDWATASAGDVEAFLALRPADRPSGLGALRHFFTWARAARLVLTDPTGGLSARQPRGYQGPTALTGLQRRLFRRWTSGDGVHPHEALTGLLTLVHGASNEELRGLATGDIDPGARSVRLGGRPQPVPLDPATWSAVESCLTYRRDLRTANPHLLTTRKTKATRDPASEDYARNVLRPAGVTPRLLRCTRLASLTVSTDPKLVSAAFGIHPQAATHYLADHVDAGRWPEATARDRPSGQQGRRPR